MICYVFLKKHTGTLIENTRTRPHGTLDIKMNMQMETFSFSPLKNHSDGGKWLLAVTSFGATNSVFSLTDENNSF